MVAVLAIPFSLPSQILMESLRDILGQRVRSFREARHLSQEQLGKAAKLGGKYVGMIERAEKAASFETIERIAGVLGVQCFELFVPLQRRTSAVERKVKSLLADKGGNDANVDEFLKALIFALKKLDRQA